MTTSPTRLTLIDPVERTLLRQDLATAPAAHARLVVKAIDRIGGCTPEEWPHIVARLLDLEVEVERLRNLEDAARAWRKDDPSSIMRDRRERALIAAVDALPPGEATPISSDAASIRAALDEATRGGAS